MRGEGPGLLASPGAMDRDAHETDQDFAQKYTRAGPIGRALVDGFFRGAGELLAHAAPRSVLEVGCGEGFSTRRLRAMLPDEVPLEAVDIERRLVEATRRRNPSVPVRQESAYALGAGDRAYDMVICMEVLEHLDRPATAMDELVRVSARWLLLSVPREPLWRVLNMARGRYLSDLGNTPGHLQHWSSRRFRAFVGERAQIVRVRHPVPWTQVLAQRSGLAPGPGEPVP